LDKALEKEILIRGRFLVMGADIEYCILQIMLFCHPNPYAHERMGKFKKMTMGEKINNVVCDVKKYLLNDYLSYKEYFDGLDLFRDMRNHVAHDKMEFINEELNPIRFAFLQTDLIDKNKEWSRYAEFNDSYLSECLEKFGKINHYLGILWSELESNFYKSGGSHPFVHPSVHIGLQNNIET
jgi:hypothetical protein